MASSPPVCPLLRSEDDWDSISRSSYIQTSHCLDSSLECSSTCALAQDKWAHEIMIFVRAEFVMRPGASLADYLLRSEEAILQAALLHSRGDKTSRRSAKQMEAQVCLV